MYSRTRNRGVPLRYPLMLVLLLTFVGLLGGCGSSTTPGSSTPTATSPPPQPTPTITVVLKGMITEFQLSASNSQTGDITAGSDGNLWFTEAIPSTQNGTTSVVGKIGRITPTGKITEFPLQSNNFASSITTGPDGNLWFTEGGAIGRMTPNGQITAFPLPSSSVSGDITSGSDKALWFTETIPNPQSTTIVGKIGRITTAGQITEFPISTPASHLFSIVSGSDGNLWFTEAVNSGQSGKIGRITPAGQISEFPLPSSSNGGEITAGPDDALWFTEFGSNKIGRLA
jgi:streptogramin lyase